MVAEGQQRQLIASTQSNTEWTDCNLRMWRHHPELQRQIGQAENSKAFKIFKGSVLNLWMIVTVQESHASTLGWQSAVSPSLELAAWVAFSYKMWKGQAIGTRSILAGRVISKCLASFVRTTQILSLSPPLRFSNIFLALFLAAKEAAAESGNAWAGWCLGKRKLLKPVFRQVLFDLLREEHIHEGNPYIVSRFFWHENPMMSFPWPVWCGSAS